MAYCLMPQFMVKDSRLLTPATTHCCLPGITRATVRPTLCTHISRPCTHHIRHTVLALLWSTHCLGATFGVLHARAHNYGQDKAKL